MKMSNINCTKSKAAILTFQSAYNFGAVLQAYALQEYLTNNFAETCILDYHNTEIDRSYAMPDIKDFKLNPKRATFRLMQSVLFRGKNNRIRQFCNEHLNLTMPYDLTSVHKANEMADIFIAGSDQVWNHLIIGNDTTYLLDFVEECKTKCSYAASIGVKTIPEDYVNLYKSCIRRLDKVSVRESEAVRTLEKIGFDKVDIMPDPTILLPREHWEKLSIKPKEKRKYILVYKITKAERLITFARELSKKTGLPIIYIPNDLKSGIVGALRLNVGPREWMGYIKNAEYVVTNSFHGTVFSILFGTKFFSEVSGKVNPSTSRLQTLLRTFELEDRIIDQYADNMLNVEVPIEKIQRICDANRMKARSFFEDVFIEE